MPDNRQTFSSRNDWHFAVVEAHPLATVRTRVLVETRVIDGVEVAGWDHSTNTGWVASDAPLNDINESSQSTPAWYVVNSTGSNMTAHTSKPSFPTQAAARAYVKTFSHAPGFKSAKVVFGTSDMHGFITPADTSSYLGEAAKTTSIDWDVGRGDWVVAKREGARVFASFNKAGNTDAVLALKTAAGDAQKRGSYLGAVLVGLCNDWFDKQR